MPATPINKGEKFSALDGLHIVFIPVVTASAGIPTRTEINAGTDLTTEIEGWSGFEVQPDELDTPGLTRFTGTIPGRIKINSGTLMMYTDRGNTDVRTVLPDGTTGTLAFMDNGDVAGKLMDLWPVRVNRLSKVRSMDKANVFDVKFTHRALPVENVAIPT